MPLRLSDASPVNDAWIDSPAKLGAAVRQARLRARMRIDDAAAFCGVSADLLSRLENGKPVTTDRLLKVLSGFGLAMLMVPRDQALVVRDSLGKAPE